MTAAVAAPAAAAPMAPGAQAPVSPPAPSGERAPAQGTPAEAKPATPKAEEFRYKTKLRGGDGREVELEFDKSRLDRTLVEHRDLSAKLTKTQKQLAERDAFFKHLEANPREALAKYGLNIDQLALERAQHEAKLAELTPEQRRIVELEQQIAETQQRQQAEKQQAEQTRAQRRQAAFREHTKSTLIESLKHTGIDLAGTQNAAARGAMLSLASKIQYRALKAGRPQYTPEQLGAEVQKEWFGNSTRMTELLAKQPQFRTANAESLRTHLDGLTAGLEGPELVNFLGKSLINRIVSAQWAMLQKSTVPQSQPQQAQQPQMQQKPGEVVPLDYYEMRRRMMNR